MAGKLFYISLLCYFVVVTVQSTSANSDEVRPEGPRCTAECRGGPHDKCTSCGNDCELTCDQPNPRPCDRICRPNVCQCESGYVRNREGMCVRPNQCQKPDQLCTRKCTGGPHDKCTTCGSACPRTCDKPNPSICTLQCLINVCECEEGYVRDKQGMCVLPSQCENAGCKRKCTGGPHDKCTMCGSACPRTCANPNPRFCTLQCLLNVCECEEGYVRNPRGKCVRLEKCPKKS